MQLIAVTSVVSVRHVLSRRCMTALCVFCSRRSPVRVHFPHKRLGPASPVHLRGAQASCTRLLLNTAWGGMTTPDAMAHIVLLGTCDTKLDELLYLRSKILQHGGIRVTRRRRGSPTDDPTIAITQQLLLSRGTPKVSGSIDVSELPRADVVKHMAACATTAVKEWYSQGQIHGVVSAGGSSGTSLASAVVRDALPVGFPKLTVSTVASGDTGPIVGEIDIGLVHSVVDIAGLNSVLPSILSNAAGSIVGMTQAYRTYLEENQAEAGGKLRVGISMFGVTTPCVDAIRRHLESNYKEDVEVYVFHATGHGGRAMERLIIEKHLEAILDITTTETCEHLMGGNMSVGPNRLEAAAQAGIPPIISLGATDMCNFGTRASVPKEHAERLLFEHNAHVTLMRTSEKECRDIGRFIVEKLTTYVTKAEKVQVWIPAGGVSMMSTPGQAFADAQADRALSDTLKEGLKSSKIRVVEDARDINDGTFAAEVAEELTRTAGMAACKGGWKRLLRFARASSSVDVLSLLQTNAAAGWSAAAFATPDRQAGGVYPSASWTSDGRYSVLSALFHIGDTKLVISEFLCTSEGNLSLRNVGDAVSRTKGVPSRSVGDWRQRG